MCGMYSDRLPYDVHEKFRHDHAALSKALGGYGIKFTLNDDGSLEGDYTMPLPAGIPLAEIPAFVENTWHSLRQRWSPDTHSSRPPPPGDS